MIPSPLLLVPFECLRALSLSAMSSRPNGLSKRLVIEIVGQARPWLAVASGEGWRLPNRWVRQPA